MIKPFKGQEKEISFGLQIWLYGVVSNEFKIFTNVNSGIVDPKVFKKESFVTVLKNVSSHPTLLL